MARDIAPQAGFVIPDGPQTVPVAFAVRPEVSGTDGLAQDRNPPETLLSAAQKPQEKSPEADNKTQDSVTAPDEEEGEPEEVADPLEPFNRAMFTFNDRLYFWFLKPVAQGYNKIVPEKARAGVGNFFNNAGFPLRFVSCIMQADFSGAGAELGRFLVNTIWGIGGLLDPASHKNLEIPKRDSDLGQTLGIYGVGQGFYIVLPVLGPSTARDSVNYIADYFIYPINRIPGPWYQWIGIRGYQAVNETSLRMGDYEAFKAAAIDPYVSMRNGYLQYREQKVKHYREHQTPPPRPGGLKFGDVSRP